MCPVFFEGERVLDIVTSMARELSEKNESARRWWERFGGKRGKRRRSTGGDSWRSTRACWPPPPRPGESPSGGSPEGSDERRVPPPPGPKGLPHELLAGVELAREERKGDHHGPQVEPEGRN